MKKIMTNVKKVFSNLNYPLLLLTIVFSIFGLIMIYSSSNVSTILYYDVPTWHFFSKQVIFEIGAYLASLIVIFYPTNKYRLFSKILMAIAIILLALLFIVGTIAGGALSWYEIGGIVRFQPVEIVKIILIIRLAVYFNKLSNKPKNNKVTMMEMLWPLIIAIIVCGLVAAQPDFGGAFIIALITFMIFYSVPIGKIIKRKIYALGIFGVVILVFSLFVFGQNFFRSYQMNRIINYSSPCAKVNYGADDTGYQVCNGFIAIHNGGLFGVGLGNSTQKRLYLPAAHTDFIFPIICEELGLVGGAVVLIGYLIMLFIILNIAKEAYTLRNSILAYGIFAYLLAHILINILGVLALIPLTGVPLPFLSYGGSYNFCVIIALFIVQRVNIENKEAAAKEKIAKL